MPDEESQKVAGHPPAVKAGGMRIVQHKNQNPKRPAKDAEDCAGLTQPVNIQNAMSGSGAPAKGMVDYTAAAAQVVSTYSPKPANQFPHKPINNINQPRK